MTPHPEKKLNELKQKRLNNLFGVEPEVCGIICTEKSSLSIQYSLQYSVIILQYFLFYGMPSHSSVTLAALYPTPMSQFDPPSPVSKLKLQTDDSGKGEPNTGAKAQTKKGKKKKSKTKKEVTQETDTIQSATERLSTVDLQSPSRNINLSSSQNSNSLRPEWNRISSSESEFSDTEGGQASKLRSFQARVRQNSLGALHGVIKVKLLLYILLVFIIVFCLFIIYILKAILLS